MKNTKNIDNNLYVSQKCPNMFQCECVQQTTVKFEYQTHVLKNGDMSNVYTLGLGFGLPILSILMVVTILVYCLRAKYSASIILSEFPEENSSSTLVQSNAESIILNEVLEPPAYPDLKPPPIYDHIQKFHDIDKLPSYNSLRKKHKSHSLA
jgi:hypothetical protein